jgi:hypothetical protein
MSFRAREKKRRQAAATSSAQARSRRKDLETPSPAAGKWWLTIVSRTTCCAKCGGVLRPGREMVYRHTPREARCVVCGEGLGARPSVRWERTRA